MLKKLFKAVIAGLALAMLIVLLLPQVRSGNLLNRLFTPQIASYRDAVRIAAPAVVNVYNRSLQNQGSQDLEINNLGSGVIMSSNGYILTNKHVIQNADQIVVALQNGNIYLATLIGSDTVTDLAVLKINAEKLPTIPQNPTRKPHVGDIVLAIGNPYNLGQSVSQGIISATGRRALSETGQQDFLQTDASINRGNSGGALINSLGELVGINTLTIGKSNNDIAEGLGFAIPITLADKIMKKIIQDGRVIRGYFGIESRVLSNNEENNDQLGILVTGVNPNGPAAQAGILPDDVLLKFGNVPAHSPAQIMGLIADTNPGTIKQIEVLRQNKKFTIPVEIGEYPIN
ncbi:outer membrane-stress sensor serine endopeptidase DegS [Mergibacter septicus]|uniref:outer membrane-stress sensor serine endopeptidase DegS n=1 Tax=Mergibacter septicus TaxID=221402 RepID=UPI001178CEC8|nr:outer membrane-stress sensor serine endopeptidase DegS [Mergibacter septicus]AWX13724.1 outer membrane-stress sensor serine endopeptidase DegS [Mergibacter septicus]